MPLLVDDLEANHFMVIVEQSILLEIPDPELFTMVAVLR
jgi:hypothetical protein